MAEQIEPTDDSDDAVEDQTSPELDDVLEDARKFLIICNEADSENRTNGLEDLQFLAGAQWDSRDALQRNMDRRPMLTINKLPAFLHQVTNSLRQNRPSIKVHPVSAGANVESAKVRQGMIRHIEYDSNADVAYDTAACSAAAIGFGYFRLITDYTSPNSFDQEIRFVRIRNPFTVRFDPLAIEPDGSDQRKCLIISKMSRADFKRQYPKASANDTALAIGDLKENWLLTDEIVIAEFYRVEETPAMLCLLATGKTVWKDEVPKGVDIVAERESFKRKVMLYKITGTDMLENTEVMCYWIPVMRVCGDEIDLDGKVVRSGLIRHAKDPARMYNYWMTGATEEIAMRPKTPYIGAHGQFEGFEKDWKVANTKSLPYIQYNPVTVDGVLAPPPARQPMADIPSGMLHMAMHANDNIKATTGLFDSSLGARGNATSGRQEIAQQRQGDISNFHFSDGLNMAVRQAGRCINWMIPHYYDTERVVQIMGEDDTVSYETINQPIPIEQRKPDPLSGAIQEVLHDMTGGEYSVTVSSGPSYQTMRQEAAEGMLELANRNPQLMGVAGDLIIAEMDFPGAEKIANRVKKSIPPNLTAGEDATETGSVEMKLAQAAQAMQMVEQKSMEMEQHAQAIMQREQELKDISLKTQGEQMQLESEKMALEAEKQVMKAEFSRLQTELKLAVSQAEGAVGGTAVEDSIEWKKALLDAQTKIAVAEISKSTTIQTASMAANKSEDGSTVLDEQGSPQLSPAMVSMVEAIVRSNQELAATLGRPRTETARAVKQPDGSFLMEKMIQ